VPLGYAGITEDAALGAGVDGDGAGVDGDGLGLAGDGVGLEGCGLEDEGLGVEADGLGVGLEDLGVDVDGLGIEADGNFFGSGVLFAVGEGPLEVDGLTPSLANAFGVGEVGAGLPNTVSAERVVSLTFSSFCSGFLGLVASWL
jgi:hypothetical protein